jgi:peptide methionine sulfoxide reductase MsrA
VIFDPAVLSIEDLLRQYYLKTGGVGSTLGQYRSQIFPVSGEQAETIRSLANGSRVPLAEPGSAEATFWPAEAYHQKYRLRRDAGVVGRMAEVLGPRWDEHVYATKLNAAGQCEFDLEPWLTEMPTVITDAFRRNG